MCRRKLAEAASTFSASRDALERASHPRHRHGVSLTRRASATKAAACVSATRTHEWHRLPSRCPVTHSWSSMCGEVATRRIHRLSPKQASHVQPQDLQAGPKVACESIIVSLMCRPLGDAPARGPGRRRRRIRQPRRTPGIPGVQGRAATATSLLQGTYRLRAVAG